MVDKNYICISSYTYRFALYSLYALLWCAGSVCTMPGYPVHILTLEGTHKIRTQTVLLLP